MRVIAMQLSNIVIARYFSPLKIFARRRQDEARVRFCQMQNSSDATMMMPICFRACARAARNARRWQMTRDVVAARRLRATMRDDR